MNVIIDTALGYDIDGMGSLSLAHTLQSQNKVNILAMTYSSGYKKGIGAVGVVNTYFNRSDIPLGAYKGRFGREVGL